MYFKPNNIEFSIADVLNFTILKIKHRLEKNTDVKQKDLTSPNERNRCLTHYFTSVDKSTRCLMDHFTSVRQHNRCLI